MDYISVADCIPLSSTLFCLQIRL